MKEVKILHTADLHLGATRTGVKGGKTEIENTFLRIIRLCDAESVDFLLIAGDLFDTPFVSSDDASKIISMLEQIPKTIVAIAPGNHDFLAPGSVYLKYKFPKNVVIFNSSTQYFDFPEKNVRLWGAAFGNRFENASLLKVDKNNFDEDTIQLCVLHGDLVSESSSSVYNPITLSSIEKSGFGYMALGHIHKRSEIQKAGNTYFAYCGCPDGMGFDETDSRGVYLGTVSKKGCDLKYTEMSSRKYIEESFDVSGCKNAFDAEALILDKIKVEFGENYAKNLYRITLLGTVSIDWAINPARLSTLLAEDLQYVEVFDQTETDIADLSLYTSESSLRGIFVKKMLEKIENASPKEQTTFKNALKIGLSSFRKEVLFNDN
ncbi:MAG: DNA repair exonuclease [Clostridia bacterium]|nr:DNA repair exonuclease [Clostridia bacterium]